MPNQLLLPPPTSPPPRALTERERAEYWTLCVQLEERGLTGRKLAIRGPQNDDELHQAVYELTGYKIPRVAVCLEHGHVAPFTIFADMYFGRRLDVLMIGNRGGGKTTISGFLHGACCRWKPRFGSTIVGATDRQSGRAYAEFKRFTRKIMHEIVDTLMSKTTWINGSEVEVITGTIKGVNGPHPHLAQFDEAELTQLAVFEEFQNMAQGDDRYPAQNLLSTTRKFAFGLIQEIVTRVWKDEKDGNTPEWDVQIFCVFETMQHVPECGISCGCEKVVKGEWEGGKPRTFASVCKGRAKRSRGFVRLEDVQRRFKRLSREVWEAQQECLRPDPEGLVHRWLNPNKHIIPVWYPNPEFGPVFRTWDWGGTNPHAILWHQLLRVPVELELPSIRGEIKTVVLKEGTKVTFDELYKGDNLSFGDLGIRVGSRTAEWANYGFPFEVEADFCDPAGGVAKKDASNGMTQEGYPEPKWKMRPCPRIESIKKHVEWGQDGRIVIVGPMCPNLLTEYATAHRPKNKDGKAISEDMVKVDDHALDSERYGIWNLYKEEGKTEEDMPGSAARDRNDPKLGKRPGMRGALGASVGSTPIMPGATDYLSESPMPEGPAVRRPTSTSPVASRGSHSLRRGRVSR